MMVSREWLIAVHEAAHAVIGIDQGQSITHAFLTRDAGGVVERGGTYARDWPQVARPGHATAAEIEACSGRGRQILAGMHAEWHIASGAPPGAKGDIDQMHDLASTMFADQSQRSAWIQQVNSTPTARAAETALAGSTVA